MRRLLLVALLSLTTFIFPITSYAQSSYVLPYPSTMPGGISYKLHVLWEKAMQYWYFGDFGEFAYNLKESDKYLVEAKTLFEYDQFLLGETALQKSDEYFTKTLPYLQIAKQHGKDITENRNLLHEAALKHIETLNTMISDTPATIYWNPEKAKPTIIPTKELIQKSIIIREKYL